MPFQPFLGYGIDVLHGRPSRINVPLFLMAIAIPSVASAQSSAPSVVITQPIVNFTDDNHVSLMTGKVDFSLPLVKLGDVEFAPFAVNGHFLQGNIIDQNYGHIVACMALPSAPPANGTNYTASGECTASTNYPTIQSVYGQSRETFHLISGQYVSDKSDGDSFVDTNDGFCTWTRKDGTQVVYYGYHPNGGVICQSQNIYRILYTDGRVIDYYYYGTISTLNWNPILSIASSDGYLIKYNYQSTPQVGAETSVVAVNRGFQACLPTSLTCTMSGSWPTALVNWQTKAISPPESYAPSGSSYNGSVHYIVTFTGQQQEKHVFEDDSIYRIISYQPPGATSPKHNYTLCTILADGTTMQHCWGMTYWNQLLPDLHSDFRFDLVESVLREGSIWNYSSDFNLYGFPSYSRWTHSVITPLGNSSNANGNASPEFFYQAGPINSVINGDGSEMFFAATFANRLTSVSTALNVSTSYTYDGRGNITQETVHPSSGSLTPTTRSASYPATCTNVLTCNKPTFVVDANGNETDYTYDPSHGGLLTDTRPAVNGVRPQKRYTYVQRYAWYLDGSGVMTRDTRPRWVLNSESYCMTGAASGNGCAIAGDEVVTTYDYGPDAGPNNLLVRGQTVTANGQTQRTCFGHDRYGNKIWQQEPKANAASCPAF